MDWRTHGWESEVNGLPKMLAEMEDVIETKCIRLVEAGEEEQEAKGERERNKRTERRKEMGRRMQRNMTYPLGQEPSNLF